MTTTTMVQEARILLIKLNLQQHFKEEFKLLKKADGNTNSGKALHKGSNISQLNPCLDKNETIYVGGRLQKSYINDEFKHSTLLPKRAKTSDLIIMTYHNKVAYVHLK